MREQIKHIEQILSLEEKTDKDEIIKTLKRTAANLHLWWRFEEISSLIFGTQLALLFFLKSRPEGMTKEEVAPYYQAHLDQLKASEVKRPIDHWLGWLKMQMLIREQGERIFLTHYADDFMQWIYNRGKTYRRMF